MRTALFLAIVLSPLAYAQWAPCNNQGGVQTCTGGKVGIGDAALSPAYDLHVRQTNDAGIAVETTGTKYAFARFLIPACSANCNNSLAVLMFQEGLGDGSAANRLWTFGFNPTTDAFDIANTAIIGNISTAVSRLKISQDGNVGLSTAPSSSYRLDVGGNLHATGDISASGVIKAKYQDVAEWVPAEDHLASGTVVTLDPSRSNHVIASHAAYDTSVAGVVSAQPGIVLGEGGAHKATVATTGRVRVRVDATSSPIVIGDLLVSSATPGMAMRSEPVPINGRSFHQPGTIIGKALEPLLKGQGEILVLLTLQ